MPKTFFTSDTHFGHANIIHHCNRPFHDVESMDQAMIEAWNKVVQPKDTVYHLGDFSLLPPEKLSGILECLHGTKHLVIGNHDRNPRTHHQWSSFHDMLSIKVDGHTLFLCHYPMREWPGMWKGTIHLYGHVHGNMKPLPGSMDVGSDVWGGTPVQISEMLPYIERFDPNKIDRQHITWRDWEND